jgi:hypothetical protein
VLGARNTRINNACDSERRRARIPLWYTSAQSRSSKAGL